MIITGALIAATFPSTASASQPPLPIRLKNCQPTVTSAGGNVDYNKCFSYDEKSQYGQVYLSFRMSDFDSAAVAKSIKKEEQKPFFKRIKSFFLPKTESGEVFLELTLLPGNGLPQTTIGVVPLASFHRSDKNGITIKRNAQTRDGFYGPVFLANANTQVMGTLHYVYSKDQSSRIGSVLSGLSSYFSSLGLLTVKALTSAKLQAGLKPLDDVVDRQFDVVANLDLPIQLSVDTASQMAAYRRVTFNGVLAEGGDLYIGIGRLRSALINPPEEDALLEFPFKGYGLASRDEVLDRVIDGVKLRTHISEAMGASFAKLSESNDADAYLTANTALGQAIDTADLGLKPDDKLALRWALLVGNPLLKRKDIRERYLLSGSEDELARLKLALPPVDLVLTEEQKQWRELGQNAASTAKEMLDKANDALRRGTDAENLATLPAPPAGYVRAPQDSLTADYSYRGQNPTTADRFYGMFTYKNGGQFVGSFVYSLVPIFDGYGRYTGGTAEPELESYTGEFVANRFSGYGIMRWKDGREFYGQFADDQPNGYGIEYSSDGKTVYYVRYSSGKRDRAAIRKRPDAPQLEPGQFEAGQFFKDS